MNKIEEAIIYATGRVPLIRKSRGIKNTERFPLRVAGELNAEPRAMCTE